MSLERRGSNYQSVFVLCQSLAGKQNVNLPANLPIPVISAIVGTAILLFGRKLFWLFVAALGFAVGQSLFFLGFGIKNLVPQVPKVGLVLVVG